MRTAAILLLSSAIVNGCSHIQPYPVGSTELVLVETRWVEPLNLWLGVWRETETCLGRRADPHALKWGMARMILTLDGRMAYGVTMFQGGRPTAIIMDRAYWSHVGIISHESIHAITRTAREATMELRLCELSTPDTHGIRRVPMDTVNHYLRLAREVSN